MNTPGPSNNILSWKQSLGWVMVGAVGFNLAYNWVSVPAMGWFIFGYALALIQLTRQTTVRRAFYWGLATGFCSYARPVSIPPCHPGNSGSGFAIPAPLPAANKLRWIAPNCGKLR